MTSIVIIVILYIALGVSDKRLDNIGKTMEEMAVQHIITNVTINENIPKAPLQKPPKVKPWLGKISDTAITWSVFWEKIEIDSKHKTVVSIFFII